MPLRTVISAARKRLLSLDEVVRDELKDTLDKSGEKLVAKPRLVVSKWKHKPKFLYVVVVGKDFVAVRVKVYGPFANIWKWVDKGTKPHRIPKFPLPYNLFFQVGYNPFTAPIALFSNSGGFKTGPWVSVKQVRHPGFPGRKFEETFESEALSEFRRDVENAFRRGIRKAMKR